MNKQDYFNSLVENGEEKVPHDFVLDILVMLYDDSKDAKVTKVNDNYSKMVLGY